jgi:P27 family predicted phage terminase small subunit
MPNNRLPRRTKMLKGTFRNDRNPVAEPEPTQEFSAKRPPAHLNRYAKKLWVDLAQECINMGTLTVADWSSFTALCEAWGEYREMWEAIYSYTDEDGKKHKRGLASYFHGKNSQTIPEYNAMRKALVDYRNLAALFGIGASNRNKIDLKHQTPEVSDTAKIMMEVG